MDTDVTDPIIQRVRSRALQHPHPLFRLPPRGHCLACDEATDEGDACSLLCLVPAVLAFYWHVENELAEENWAGWCEEMKRWDTLREDEEENLP